MKVKELKSILENIPDDVEVTVWASAADCCHTVESAFHIMTDSAEEVQSQFALFENSIKFQDIVKRGFTLASAESQDDSLNHLM